ncbi:hypothetical protein EDD34_1844 [Myceligenerans xiligouense]|uniref:Uncharacterized protein n=1 Tax=Myceligenerans xiligouense TaxID=253184 RepID=A0A3N4ZMR7_9MICO|nr:hypothetical protein EDD34_1844 [Myceligenerans xiligouense]
MRCDLRETDLTFRVNALVAYTFRQEGSIPGRFVSSVRATKVLLRADRLAVQIAR